MKSAGRCTTKASGALSRARRNRTGSGQSSLYGEWASIACRLLAADLVPDLGVVRLTQEQAADNKRDAGHNHGVVESRVDVPCGSAAPQPDQRKHSAKNSVADVIGQREGGVANLGREGFDGIRSDGTVHHADENHLN